MPDSDLVRMDEPAPRIGERGVFTVSLDTELAWGRWDSLDRHRYEDQYRQTRVVIRNLLDLFERYTIPATWAVVGILYDEKPQSGVGALSGDLFSAPEIVSWIRSSGVPHEIGSHSYAHPDFTELDRSGAEKDIRQAVRVAADHGLPLRSFVYPRNRIAHVDVLAEHGFTCFRGRERTRFFEGVGPLRRWGRIVESLLPIAPTVTHPRRLPAGVVEVPASMLFRVAPRGRNRWRSLQILRSRAVKGLERAASRRGVFHLWFHPFNFAHRREAHLEALESVLRTAVGLRDRGRLEVLTMSQMAMHLMNRGAPEFHE